MVIPILHVSLSIAASILCFPMDTLSCALSLKCYCVPSGHLELVFRQTGSFESIRGDDGFSGFCLDTYVAHHIDSISYHHDHHLFFGNASWRFVGHCALCDDRSV